MFFFLKKKNVRGPRFECTVVSAPKKCLSFCLYITEVNDCSSHPCQNGGSCCDKGDRYECKCPDGYSGTHCETGKIIFVSNGMLLTVNMVVPCRAVLYRIVSYRVVLYLIVLYRVMSCLILSCHVVLCCIVLYRVVSCPVASYRVVSCRVVSCRIVLYRIVSCRFVLSRVELS